MLFIKYFFLLVLTTFLFSNVSVAKEKVAFVDIDYLLNESTYGKSILNELKSINENNIDKLKLREEKLKSQESEINKTKNIISEEVLKKKITNLKDDFEKFRNEKNKMANDFNQKRQSSLSKFLNDINPLIQKYMDENSISLLIEKKNVFIHSTFSAKSLGKNTNAKRLC